MRMDSKLNPKGNASPTPLQRDGNASNTAGRRKHDFDAQMADDASHSIAGAAWFRDRRDRSP
jgi:hypothetical protein